MAIKSGIIEVQAFSLKDDEEPKTIVYGKPLTERQRKSVMRTRRGEIEIDTIKLLEKGLAQDEKGVYIRNIVVGDKMLKEVKDKEAAVKILSEVTDLVFLESLKSWLMGMSVLDEAEIKNLKLSSA